MTKLVESIKQGPKESGMGHYLEQGTGDKAAQRSKKDPLFGISGKRGIGPYSKQSERVQGLSLTNRSVANIKKSEAKDKEQAEAIRIGQIAEEEQYRKEHPAPVSDSQSEKLQMRKKVAAQRRSSGRLSTVLSETLG